MNINIRELEFSYTNEKTLNGVSGDLEKGEFISIIGPNGTGKSTLIKCINGILKAQKGLLSINDVNIEAMTQNDIARVISYVPQSTSSLFNLSVFDMVLLGRRPHATWRSSKVDRLKALKAMKTLDIESLAMKSFNELSGGQKQKVVIARAIAQETKIIVLDEPISNLDIKHQIEVMEILKSLVDNTGVTAISVVHDLNIAIKYSNKIMVMHKGKAVAIGDPKIVLTKEMIASVYGVEVTCSNVEDNLVIIPQKIICS